MAMKQGGLLLKHFISVLKFKNSQFKCWQLVVELEEAASSLSALCLSTSHIICNVNAAAGCVASLFPGGSLGPCTFGTPLWFSASYTLFSSGVFLFFFFKCVLLVVSVNVGVKYWVGIS